MKQYDVYGIGNALVDTEIKTDDAFLADCQIEKGVMTLADLDSQNELISLLDGKMLTAKKASGGSGANSIIAISQLGGSSYYSCKVASDEMGDFYLEDLKTAGVDADFSQTRDAGITGKCLVMITPDAERTMSTYLGISESLSMSEISPDRLIESKWLYIEGYLVTSDTARTAAIACRETAEKAGVKTAISLSDPSMIEFFKDGLMAMIGDGVDLVFCNQDEAFAWTGKQDIDSALTALKAIAKSVIITRQSEGAVIFDGKETLSIDANPVDAIDTNGAGDAFAGAYLYGISNGFDSRQSGELAALVASKVVSQYGPRLSKQEYQELSQTIKP